MRPLISLSAAALLMIISAGGMGCSSNPQAAQNGDQSNVNQPQAAGYHQNSVNQASQAERGDTGNGAFGETPP